MKLRKITSALAVTAALAAVAVAPASAADDTNVTVTGGSLSMTNPTVADFAGVTLDGTAKSTTATQDNFSVTDARGTGAGWNVTVQATQFQEHNGLIYVVGGRSLPQNSLSMPAVTVAKGDSSSSASPAITSGPYTIDSAGAVKIATAAADGTGMGSYNFTQGGSLTLSVAASAYAKTYRSDVTYTAATGP
jgi:hypothetical protein